MRPRHEHDFPEGHVCLHCRDTKKKFMAAMPSVYDRILACFALGLGYPEDFFKRVCAQPQSPGLTSAWTFA